MFNIHEVMHNYMKAKKEHYVIINLETFGIDVYRFKGDVADAVKCHRNSLKSITRRMVINNYLIVPVEI